MTAGRDRTTRLWDVRDPQAPREILQLCGHTDTLREMVFSSDGHTLFSSGSDDIVLRWETDPELVAKRVCEVATPRITSRVGPVLPRSRLSATVLVTTLGKRSMFDRVGGLRELLV